MTATTLQREAVLPRSYDKISAAVRIPSRRVYICSPLKGDIRANIRKAKKYCRFAFGKGYIPWAPHLYYAQFLDDGHFFERAAGRRYGLEEMYQMHELWVFGAVISEGMRAEIELAEDLEIRIRYFDEALNEVRYGCGA